MTTQNQPNQPQTPFQAAAANATSSQTETSPQTTETPAPAPSPDEFSGNGPDLEGAVADFLAIQDFEDEGDSSPSPDGQQVPPASPVETPAAPQTATPGEQQATPQSGEQPQTPPPQTAVPPQQTPPVQQPAAQPTPEQTPQEATPPALAPGQFAQLAQAVQQQRDVLEGHLASMYTPSEQEMEDFLDKPEKVMGKLAARLHMEVVQNTLGVLAQNIPAAVIGVLQVQKTNEEYENRFFTKWPQLDRKNPQHWQVLQQIGRAYAQANPQADAQTRMQQIGAQAIVALNLLPTQAPPQQQQVQTPAPAFAPAGNGVAPAPQGSQLEGWEAISQALGSDFE